MPAEIIKRIATYLPVQSALALMKANRQFHNLVNDRLVFKTMLETQSGFDNKSTLAWTSGLYSILPSKNPSSTWARLALANEKASSLLEPHAITSGYLECEPLPGQETSPWTRLLSWLPQLLILHHPILTSEPFLSSIAGKIEPHYGLPQLKEMSALDLSLSLLVLQPEMSQLILGIADVNHQISWLKTILLPFQTYYHLNAATFRYHTVFLCQLLESLRMDVRSDRGPPLVWPPTATNIPFQSFMDLSLPFSKAGLEEFQSSHLEVMVSKAFLEDGDWAAYYSIGMEARSQGDQMLFRPPMTDIRFSVVGTEEERFQLAATGADPEGPLTADGSVDLDGNMEMEETNWGGGNWMWKVKMCPIGLFGTWGTRQVDNGFLWMFKRDWCYKSASEST